MASVHLYDTLYADDTYDVGALVEIADLASAFMQPVLGSDVGTNLRRKHLSWTPEAVAGDIYDFQSYVEDNLQLHHETDSDIREGTYQQMVYVCAAKAHVVCMDVMRLSKD